MPDQYHEFENLIQAGELRVAEQRLFEWIRDHPNDSHAWLLYGKSVTSPTQKRDCYKRALALDPSNAEAMSRLQELDAGVSPTPSATSVPQRGKGVPAAQTPPPSPSTFQTYIPPPKSPQFNETTKARISLVLYSLGHFLFTALLGAGIVLLLSAMVPSLLQINPKGETVQRGWLSTSDSSNTNNAYQALGGVFLNPSGLDYRGVSSYDDLRLLRANISVDATPAQPIQFTGVRFVGQLVGGSVLQSGKDGQPLVVVMQIQLSEIRMPVLYYGPVNRFHYEDTVRVEGVYIADPSGVVAQRVENLSAGGNQAQPMADTQRVLRVAGIVLLWALLCVSVFIWRINLRRWWKSNAVLFSTSSMLLFLLPVTLFITGCSIDMSTTLRADGTGVTTILGQETTQNMDFLRSAPGVSGYLDAILQDVRKSGATFEQYVEGDQEFFLLQRYLNTSSDDTGDTYPVNGSWISVQRYAEGNEEVIRFLGVVDTRGLYANSPGMSSDVAGMLHDQLNQITMTYHLNVPGQIVYHNGDQASNQQVSWQLRMNDVNFLVAEARIQAQNKPAPESFLLYTWIAIGSVFLISTLLLIASIWIHSKPRGAGRPE